MTWRLPRDKTFVVRVAYSLEPIRNDVRVSLRLFPISLLKLSSHRRAVCAEGVVSKMLPDDAMRRELRRIEAHRIREVIEFAHKNDEELGEHGEKSVLLPESYWKDIISGLQDETLRSWNRYKWALIWKRFAKKLMDELRDLA